VTLCYGACANKCEKYCNQIVFFRAPPELKHVVALTKAHTACFNTFCVAWGDREYSHIRNLFRTLDFLARGRDSKVDEA
jgi:hypothetical protein